jgi:Phage terminase, small subunit
LKTLLNLASFCQNSIGQDYIPVTRESTADVVVVTATTDRHAVPNGSVVVPAVVQTTWAEPTRNLSKHGRALWDRVKSEYDICDSGGVEMLMQACEAQDRIAKVRQEIDEDGEVIRARGQVKEHPALKIELSLRSFVVRTLARLGLNFEPIRSTAGRPGLWS